MHSITESENGRLMAQWRATGGAIQAQAFEAAGDDGLSALATTRGYLCEVDDGLEAGGRLTNTGRLSCGRDCADDGLAAMQFTTDMHPYARCSGDDGLAAVQFTVASGGGICTDDGLRAAEASNILRCLVDDGLEAGRGTGSLWSHCGDDGLAAVQFTGRAGCPPRHGVVDDGLQAGRVTGMHIPGVCGDDGLAQ